MTPDEARTLLRQWEPVVRYTRGEKFFPLDVGSYVRASSLWVQQAGRPAQQLVAEGELTLERLTEPRAHGFDAIYFLRFIEPLNVAELAAVTLQQVQENLLHRDDGRFHAGVGRLARVGYSSRLVDALFSLTLLARGRVPGDAAAAAAMEYRRLSANQQRFPYYARVVQQAGWTVLQYWFFYPFNNWRSGFYGVNDHEADWEMVVLYLAEDGAGQLQPEWVAYASHDFQGDDLRRRWDDPEVQKLGNHPIIYAGAGSHASYFLPGEYVTEIEIPLFAPLARAVAWLDQARRRLVEQFYDMPLPDETGAGANIFHVPFVDYARGDGRSIGPGQPFEWAEPTLLEPTPDWARRYRGLWGLYARDPISGENAPAGPLYNRDGSIRRSWYDPVGWAGLEKVPPPAHAVALAEAQRRALAERQGALALDIARTEQELAGLGVTLSAMAGRPHLRARAASHAARIEALSAALAVLRAEQAEDEALLAALERHAAALAAGARGPLRAHIHRAHLPASPVELRLNRVAETWAALSIGVAIIVVAMLLLFARAWLLGGMAALLFLLLLIEAAFRRQLATFVAGLTNALALIAVVVLVYDFALPLLLLAVLSAGAYLLWDNLRELSQ